MKQQQSLILAGLLLLTSILVGTLFYNQIEGFKLIDAFYMTVITISTVGFSEVRGLSVEGRIFTSIYIIFNLAILAYVISVFSSYFFHCRSGPFLNGIACQPCRRAVLISATPLSLSFSPSWKVVWYSRIGTRYRDLLIFFP